MNLQTVTARAGSPECHNDLPAVLPTDEAAAAINRKPQTLRKWACLENGPIRPIRINGRLAWRVADLQSLLRGAQQ
ncbi:helix-turn-helix domain-containing protein [Caballeronia sp. NCTM1]|uniref:helix-turn-helix domain-containing protein n=1 Tax=Caballeronia sp. NCTM1 TaxID=2921753 RepID=UPI0020279A05|nr:helix-turn-helix domain-containing protein [Caballeronia sp. NCTM1]